VEPRIGCATDKFNICGISFATSISLSPQAVTLNLKTIGQQTYSQTGLKLNVCFLASKLLVLKALQVMICLSLILSVSVRLF